MPNPSDHAPSTGDGDHRAQANGVIAIIPARGGSKGLPRKNVLPINGRPLIEWSIVQALATPGIDTVMVSTDDDEIAAVARQAGAEVPFMRPAELARDDTATEPVLLHALDWYRDNGRDHAVMILLQPTSPLRQPGSIAAALDRFRETGADSLLSVCENHHFFWSGGPVAPTALYDYRHRPRRQDIADADRWYRETGSVYITDTATFRATNNRLAGRIATYVAPAAEGYEIDDRLDFAVVGALMKECELK